MLVISGATQSSNLYFGVMFIPTTSPYLPSNTALYHTPNLDNYLIRGLFISSPTCIRVLFCSSSQTYLATLILSDEE